MQLQQTQNDINLVNLPTSLARRYGLPRAAVLHETGAEVSPRRWKHLTDHGRFSPFFVPIIRAIPHSCKANRAIGEIFKALLLNPIYRGWFGHGLEGL